MSFNIPPKQNRNKIYYSKEASIEFALKNRNERFSLRTYNLNEGDFINLEKHIVKRKRGGGSLFLAIVSNWKYIPFAIEMVEAIIDENSLDDLVNLFRTKYQVLDDSFFFMISGYEVFVDAIEWLTKNLSEDINYTNDTHYTTYSFFRYCIVNANRLVQSSNNIQHLVKKTEEETSKFLFGTLSFWDSNGNMFKTHPGKIQKMRNVMDEIKNVLNKNQRFEDELKMRKKSTSYLLQNVARACLKNIPNVDNINKYRETIEKHLSFALLSPQQKMEQYKQNMKYAMPKSQNANFYLSIPNLVEKVTIKNENVSCEKITRLEAVRDIISKYPFLKITIQE
jgi:hypothetical protein